MSLVDDLMMLHGMGVRLVLVLGCAPQARVPCLYMSVFGAAVP